MRINRVLCLYLSLVIIGIGSGSKAQTSKSNERPLPPVTTVQSKLTSTQAFPKIFVTYPLQSNFPSIVVSDADAALEDAKLRKMFLNGEGEFAALREIPNSRKIDRDVHYELGDPRITQLTIDQVNKGFGRVVRITDFNTVLELKDGEKTTSDFNRLIKEGKFQDNEKARELQRILKELSGKYEIFGSDHLLSEAIKSGRPLPPLLITSQPVFPDDGSEKPILHNKEWVDSYLDEKGKEVPVIGSIAEINYTLPKNVTFDKDGKASPQARMNISYVIQEPNILQNIIDHTDNMLKALGDGKTIADIETVSPVEVVTQDGGKVRLYYTDGKYNAWQLHTAVINDAIHTLRKKMGLSVDPELPPQTHEVELDEIHERQFVFTYKPLLEAFEKYFDLILQARKSGIQVGTKLLGLYENQFAKLNGEGFAPIFAGFAVDRPLGGQIRDFKNVFERNPDITTYVEQRDIPGLLRTDADAAPTDVYLNHGKGSYIKARINGKETTVIGDGSFNESGHTANSESHFYMELPSESEFAQANMDLLPQILKLEVPNGYAVPMRTAVTRNGVADFTNHLTLEIPLDGAREVVRLIDSAQKTSRANEIIKAYGAVLEKLGELYKLSTVNKKKVGPEEFASRVSKVQDFIKWYSQLPPSPNSDKWGNGLDAPRFFALVMNVSDPREAAFTIKRDLNFVLWRSELTPEELEKRIKDAWKVLKIEKPIPSGNSQTAERIHGASAPDGTKADRSEKADKPDDSKDKKTKGKKSSNGAACRKKLGNI